MSDVDRIIALIRDWHQELATDETGVEEHVEALVENALRGLVAERDAARARADRLLDAVNRTDAERYTLQQELSQAVVERGAAQSSAADLAATVGRVEFLANRWAVTRASTSTTYVAAMIRAAIAGDARAAAAEIGGQS